LISGTKITSKPKIHFEAGPQLREPYAFAFVKNSKAQSHQLQATR